MFYKIPNAEVFEAGTYDGVPYGIDFLDGAVKNFERLHGVGKGGDRLDVPVLSQPDIDIGHEGDRAKLVEILGRTDNLAGGWISRLWRRGNKLFADIDGIPEEINQLIRDGKLRTCSAEFYGVKDQAGNEIYPVFRRLALLGAEQPKVKTLKPLPLPVPSAMASPAIAFSDSKGVWRVSRQILFFSEFKYMDRQTILTNLAALGFDTSLITEVVPDALLQQILESLQGKSSAPASSLPTNPASINAETPPGHKEPDGDENKPVLMSELKRLLVSEVQNALRPVMPGITRLQQFSESQKKAKIEKAVDGLIRAGKIFPFERDQYIAELSERDDSAVLKFSDGSSGSALDQKIAVLEKRPVIQKFSEQMTSPLTMDGKPSADRIKSLKESTPMGQAIAKKTAEAKK